MQFTATALVGLFVAPIAFAAPSPIIGGLSNIWGKTDRTFYFDAQYTVKATPEQVIASTGEAAPGQPGAVGLFRYGINIAQNTICYNITLSGVTGEYKSPAATATHIHEAAAGKAGPPRIVSVSFFFFVYFFFTISLYSGKPLLISRETGISQPHGF